MKLALPVRLILLCLSSLLFWGCSAESKRARMLDRAGEYYKKSEFEKARIEYQNVLQGDPDNLTANERLALIWMERGSPMRAAAHLVKMKGLAPGNLELRLKLARIMLAMGNTNEARREALLIVERSESFPDALVLLAESVRSSDDLKAADQVLQRMADKNSVQHLIASATLMVLRTDTAGAKAALQKAITRDPKSSDAHLAMAGLLAGINEAAEAREMYRKAAELSTPRSPARLRYATFLAQTGGIAEAVTYLTELSRQEPDYMPAFRGLAELAIAEKKFDVADAQIKTLFAKDGADFEARLLRARLWQAQGDVNRAIQELEQFGKDFPGLGVEKHQLGLAYLQVNDQPNAIKALQESVARNPDNLDGMMLLAQLLLRNGAPQPASALLAEVVNRRPNFAQAYPLLIEAMRAQGKLDQAAEGLQKGVTASPNNVNLHYALGLVRVQQQKFAEARPSFEKVVELAPDHLLSVGELIGLDLREGKTQPASERVKKMLVKSPNSIPVRVLEARVNSAAKKWDEVEAGALKILELDPRQTSAYGLIAESFAARKTDPATAARVSSFLTRRPNDEMAAIVGGQYFTQANDFAKAREVYEHLLVTKPDAVAVLNNLAALHAERLNQPERALEVARKARKLEPASAVVADTLGWILYQRKEYQEAAALLTEAAKAIGGNAEVQYHVGMVQSALGHKEAAVAALKAAVSVSGNFTGKEDAQRELAKLEKQSDPTAKTP